MPRRASPRPAESVAKFVFITHPVEAVRTTLLDGQPISVWGTGGWIWMTGTAAAWLALGVLAFGLGNRTAKRHGSLTRH